MTKNWTVRTFAIPFKVLRYNCGYRHGNTNETVVVDTNPNNIKPSQAALRCSPNATLATTAFGEPINRQDPWLDRPQFAKEFFLTV